MGKSKNEGITLIAIVITIIVLLILAGFSISLFMGESGILTKVEKAKTQTNIAEDKENIKIEINELLIEKDVNKKI